MYTLCLLIPLTLTEIAVEAPDPWEYRVPMLVLLGDCEPSKSIRQQLAWRLGVNEAKRRYFSHDIHMVNRRADMTILESHEHELSTLDVPAVRVGYGSVQRLPRQASCPCGCGLWNHLRWLVQTELHYSQEVQGGYDWVNGWAGWSPHEMQPPPHPYLRD